MTFAPGDPVHVAALGKGIVREVRNAGRYLVELRGRSVVVAGSQLTPVDSARTSRRTTRLVADSHEPAAGEATRASPSLDLHGRTVDEAVEALTAFLNTALLDGHAGVRVIHGRSGGKLRAAVHARLKQMSSIRGFRLDPRNPGVTMVRL